jgi:uncharacterized protein YdhG (YjbR/CyaY superfamily)
MAEKKGSLQSKAIDEYIAALNSGIQPTMKKLRETIGKAVPEATEVISYQMPALKLKDIVMYFAAFTNHYSVFVRPMYLDPFRGELNDYKTTKSGINIPNSQPVPVKLITRIAKHAAKQIREKKKFGKGLR